MTLWAGGVEDDLDPVKDSPQAGQAKVSEGCEDRSILLEPERHNDETWKGQSFEQRTVFLLACTHASRGRTMV